MDVTTETPVDIVVAAFWLVEGRRSIFKRTERVTYSCLGTFYFALAAFYPADYDSCRHRQEIVALVEAGESVHIDCWGLHVLLLPGGYQGKSGATGGRPQLESFLGYGETQPKQIAVAKRPS